MPFTEPWHYGQPPYSSGPGQGKFPGHGHIANAPPKQQGLPVVQFFPDPATFIPQTMDVWTGNGTVPPPSWQGSSARLAGININIVFVWPEGRRTKVTASDSYTHIVLCDPTITIIDPYRGNGQTLAVAYDALAIPAGQTSNWWNVRFSFLTYIPQMGERRVILADRFGTPGSWTSLV